MSRDKELQKLIQAQQEDRRTYHIRAHVVQTTPFKPYSEITDEEKRSILILFKCKVEVREIGRLLHLSHETIYSRLQSIFEDFPQYK